MIVSAESDMGDGVLCCLQVFKATGAAAALAAGIFHRKEVGIDEVKLHMAENQVPTRIEA
jgi:imidazole glycerol phosphate synthase subunit HisF